MVAKYHPLAWDFAKQKKLLEGTIKIPEIATSSARGIHSLEW